MYDYLIDNGWTILCEPACCSTVLRAILINFATPFPLHYIVLFLDDNFINGQTLDKYTFFKLLFGHLRPTVPMVIIWGDMNLILCITSDFRIFCVVKFSLLCCILFHTPNLSNPQDFKTTLISIKSQLGLINPKLHYFLLLDLMAKLFVIILVNN